MSIRYEIRAALPPDEDDLLELATHLNSVNLPADRAAIRSLLEHSEQSFSAQLEPANQRKYVFILRDVDADRAVGTSTLFAQLGRKDAPYVYFDVFKEERYSKDLELHFEHQALRLGFSYDGPTELGGLVVDPRYRRQPERLGLCISYARFLYICRSPQLFQKVLLAELLPPLEADGTSHLWDAVGSHFTDLSYREADRLSHENKDFIRDLFPRGIVYCSVLPKAAQAVIGEVGQSTKGVEKMLTRIGFHYGDRVDPFDGGPHFFAKTSEVTVIQRYRSLPAALRPGGPKSPALLGKFSAHAPYFQAAVTSVEFGDETLGVCEPALRHLDAQAGAEVQAVPVP